MTDAQVLCCRSIESALAAAINSQIQAMLDILESAPENKSAHIVWLANRLLDGIWPQVLAVEQAGYNAGSESILRDLPPTDAAFRIVGSGSNPADGFQYLDGQGNPRTIVDGEPPIDSAFRKRVVS